MLKQAVAVLGMGNGAQGKQGAPGTNFAPCPEDPAPEKLYLAHRAKGQAPEACAAV